MILARLCECSLKRGFRALSIHALFKNDVILLQSNTLLLRVFPKSPAEVSRNLWESSTSRKLPPIHVGSNEDIFPTFRKSLKNFWTINFHVKQEIDSKFSEDDFLDGAKQAKFTVSNAIANQEYENLSGLVTEDEIQFVRNRVMTYTDEQRELIAIRENNIAMSFIADTKIITNNDSDESKTLQVQMISQYMKDIETFKSKNLMEQAEYYKENILISNYIFYRVYTKDSPSDWIISYINHFSL